MGRGDLSEASESQQLHAGCGSVYTSPEQMAHPPGGTPGPRGSPGPWCPPERLWVPLSCAGRCGVLGRSRGEGRSQQCADVGCALSYSLASISLLPGLIPPPGRLGPQLMPGARMAVPPSGQGACECWNSELPTRSDRRHPGLGMSEGTQTCSTCACVLRGWSPGQTAILATCSGSAGSVLPATCSALPPASFCGPGSRVSTRSGACRGLPQAARLGACSWLAPVCMVDEAHLARRQPL